MNLKADLVNDFYSIQEKMILTYQYRISKILVGDN